VRNCNLHQKYSHWDYLQDHSLSEILSWCTIEYPSIDTQLILKSLVYFDDLEDEEIIYKEQHDTDFEIIKMFLKKQEMRKKLKPIIQNL